MQDYSRLWQRLSPQSIPPELLSPEARLWAEYDAELSYFRAYAYWRSHQESAFAAELKRCETLQGSQQTLAPWKILLLQLSSSLDLNEQASLCLKIYQCFHSRLSISLLDDFLTRFFPEWDRGLLWAGAACHLAHQGQWVSARKLRQQVCSSRYPAERNAWLAQSCWFSQDHVPAWQWLHSEQALQVATPWLLAWCELLEQARYPQLGLQLLEQAWRSRPGEKALGRGLAAHYERRGLFAEALTIYQTLPAEPACLQRQAEILKTWGETAQAAQLLEQALCQRAESFPRLDPDPAWAQLHSQYQICLVSLAETSAEQITAAQQDWVRRFSPAEPLAALPLRGETRRLRIAYLSADFCLHSSYPMITALFHYHDHSQFELFAYHAGPWHDIATQQLRALSEHWREVAGTAPLQIAQMLQSDEIDILVDLSGHTSLSQLSVIAFQPAPLQITGLCFNGATGLPQFSHRFTDPICSPPQTLDTASGEKPLYLSSWVIWPPPTQDIPLRQPSQRQQMGCVHHPGRISLQLLQLWAQILKERPTAVLHFKNRCFENQKLRQKYLQFFAAEGIQPQQLHFEGASAYPAYLEFYNQLDLALDAWPYHGGLTTCDSLWMGIPLLSLKGPMRGNQSLLEQVHHPEWLAANSSDYVTRALELLDAPPDLSARQALRHQVLQAPFAQPAARVKEIEQFYLQIWQQASTER